MQSSALTIKEVVDTYGISLRTLRFYEERGLLNPVRAGTRRFYTERDKIRLQLILKGKRLGFTLQEIERLLSETSATNQADQGELAELALDCAQVGERLEILGQRRDSVHRAIGELQKVLETKP